MQAFSEADFEQVVRSRDRSLRRTALVLCGDRGVAEDLVQTVFLRLHGRWRRGGIDDLDAYLHVSLVNASRSRWRRSWRAQPLVVDVPGGDAFAGVDLRDAVLRALRTLPPAQREVLAWRYLAGCIEDETARVLGCATGTVKSRASRALATLRVSGLLDDAHRTGRT